jgi:capsular polysaccharide biosynthesis protein
MNTMGSRLFLSTSFEDWLFLLRAWRLWLAAALLGGLLGWGAYTFAPLPYRARATVLVDFNMEIAWPTDTDREQFYYLERETRKLEEIAWSDRVMQQVAEQAGQTSIAALRAGKLQLGQPGEGGWHFYAFDADPQRAARLAAAWAEAFAEAVTDAVRQDAGLNRWIQVQVTQERELPVERRPSLSICLLSGSLGLSFLTMLLIAFFAPWHPSYRAR